MVQSSTALVMATAVLSAGGRCEGMRAELAKLKREVAQLKKQLAQAQKRGGKLMVEKVRAPTFSPCSTPDYGHDAWMLSLRVQGVDTRDVFGARRTRGGTGPPHCPRGLVSLGGELRIGRIVE